MKAIRVGVLDDSATTRLVTTRLLARVGYETLELETPEQLLQAMGSLDIVLMDLSMGEVDGRDVAAQMAEMSGGKPALPLIAVTAFVTPELEADPRVKHFVDFLHKPFRPQQLYDKIEKWAGQGKS